MVSQIIVAVSQSPNPNPPNMLTIPSPPQEISHPICKQYGVRLLVKRDDLIHPEISGNKWRKLKYNIEACKANKRSSILTFGGAFSNHILATAAAGQLHGIPTIGLIRGEHANTENPTLKSAREKGMQIYLFDHETWSLRTTDGFSAWLHEQYGNVHIVPEGGANYYGVAGTAEIMSEVQEQVDVIVVPFGTGTTTAGIAASLKSHQTVFAVQVLKAEPMLADLRKLLYYYLGDSDTTDELLQSVEISNQWHCGGYAKRSEELETFIQEFFKQTGILTDPIYTGKMFYGLFTEIRQGKWAAGTTIMAIHTGGLQGIAGYEQRYRVKIT